MEKIFDLQRFASILDLTSSSASVNSAGFTKGSTTIYAIASGDLTMADTSKVATLNLTSASTLTGTSMSANLTKVSSISVTSTLGSGVLFGETNSFKMTDTNGDTVFTTATGENGFTAKSATISKGVLTAFTGLGISTGSWTFEQAASGTVLMSDGATYTLSNFKGTLATDNNVTGFTAGTLTLKNSYTQDDSYVTIKGVGAAGGSYTAGTLSDKTEYITASLSGSSKTFDLTGAEVAFNVIGTSGIDTITVASGYNHSVKAGSGSDNITLADTDKAVYIMGEAGNDIITASGGFAANNSSIYGGAGNDEITLATGAAKEVSVDGGDGNDTIALASGITYATVLGGAGKDTILSMSDTNVVTGGADADFFVMTGEAKANITDYAYGTDALYLAGGSAASVAANAAVTTEGALGSDDKNGFVGVNGGTATITSSAGYFAVNLKDADGGAVDLGWVGDNKATINGGSVNRSMVLAGTTNTEGDLLIGGAKADTLYAGASDSVYGGAGADSISIATNAAGVYVGIATNSGKDTVAGFTDGFDINESDAVYVVSGSASDVGASIDSDGHLVVTDGSASLDLGEFTAKSTNAYELLIGTSKVAVAKAGEVIKTDDLSYADYWLGTYDSTTKTGSGVDLSDVSSVMNLNLGTASNVRNMTSVTGGSGVTTLIGSSAAEYLVAATGSTTSLYGGAGNDTLISASDAKTEFFFMDGSGKDTIQGFLTGDTADVLNFFGSGLGSIVRSDESTVIVTTADGSKLTVEQAASSADAKLQWVSGSASGVAKIASSVGGTLSYESDVTQYIGASQKDTLTVATTDGSGVNLWLDGSQGVSYSDIDIIDASTNASNTTVAGSSTAETITGGSGNASLWGGAGTDADVLNATSGSTTMFFYGLNQGNDVINGSSNDVVNLYGLNLADITSANIESSRVVFATTANDTVTVNGVQTFQLADGSQWKADYTTNTWTQA